MNKPTKSDDITNEIIISSDLSSNLGDLRIRQLIKVLDGIDEKIILSGVLKIFQLQDRLESEYLDQEFAGRILEHINPKPNEDLKALLMTVIPNWNKSVKNLPIWIYKNYDSDNIKNAFAEIKLSNNHNDKIEAMDYWIKAHLAYT